MHFWVYFYIKFWYNYFQKPTAYKEIVMDYYFGENEIHETPKQAEQTHIRKKDFNATLSAIFLVAAILLFVGSLVCGILFGFTEITRFNASTKLITERVFEIWKFLLFFFVGIGSGGSLLGTSFVFKALSKKGKK